MTVTISKIQQVAKGGFARIDAAGEWKTGGKGLGGRVVAWFTGIVSRGKATRENRTAIDGFVRAIGSDARYGDYFVSLAEQKLKPLFAAGKPLRERTVTQVLSEVEDIRVGRDEINHSTAERFSNTDPKALSQAQNYPHNFTAELRKAGQKCNLPQSIETVHAAYTEKAAEDIRQEILTVGDNGKKQVSLEEAQKIAERRIGKLTDQLVTLNNILKASDMGEEEKHSVRQRLACEPDLGKEVILSYIHGGRTSQLAYESGELPKMLSRAATAEGISEIAGDITLQAGVDSNMVIRVTDRLKADFPNAVATKEEVLARFSSEVSRYVATRKQVMDHADIHDLTGEARTEMRKMIAQDPSIKQTAQIDAIIAAAPGYEAFSQSLSAGGTEAMAAAFVRHQKSFDRAMGPLMHSGMTVDETAPRRTQALSLWVAQQKDKGRGDPGQAAAVRRDMKLAYDNLIGPAGDRWVDSTVWVAEQNRRVDSKVDGIARTVQNLRHAMAAEIGDYLGINPADVPDASPTREGIASNISGEADVSDNVYCMFRDLGVEVSPPDLMGRSKKEAFDDRFNENFLQAINEELNMQGNLTDGIGSTMYRDLDRANYYTGEPGTPESLLTSARTGEGREAALGIFNRLFDDNHDEAGKQAVSKITHQGIFAEIDMAFIRGCGPFSQPITLEQSDNKSDIGYRIWQEPGGTGYRVRASLSAPVKCILNPMMDLSMQNTDMETSKFSFEATIRISRESIDAGNPRAELVTAPTYEYRIDPEQEGKQP